MSTGNPGCGRRDLPKPLRDVLNPAVQQLVSSDQARAFAAWTQAAGAAVAAAARPNGLFNGVLTVECPSSIWANELTYLGGQILDRMNELVPGQPVRRLRFVVARPARSFSDEAPAARGVREANPRLTPVALTEAHSAASGIRDDRLRDAIETALRAASGQS